MKKALTIILILTFGLTLFFCSGKKGGDGSQAAGEDIYYELGQKVTDFTLKDIYDTEFDLDATLAREDVNGVVFIFISKNCHTSLACDDRYVEYADEFLSDGILLVGINPNSDETIEEIKAHAEEQNFTFPVLKDWNNVMADRFDAMVTPEVYFIDKEGILIYHGRIDDSHDYPTRVQEKTLSIVVSEYLAGQELSYTDVRGPG
ncbi:redoxin domain-containing protein [candidate division KSB1 bacterium]